VILRTTIIASALLAIAAPSHADLYRCDISGRTVYQDSPCAVGQRSRVITTVPASNESPVEARIQAQRQVDREISAAKELDRKKERDEERARQDRQAYADREVAIAITEEAKAKRCRLQEVDVLRAESEAIHHMSDSWSRKHAADMRAKFRIDCW